MYCLYRLCHSGRRSKKTEQIGTVLRTVKTPELAAAGAQFSTSTFSATCYGQALAEGRVPVVCIFSRCSRKWADEGTLK